MAEPSNEELFKTWMANERSRDPRDLDVARRRALGLPDDAPQLVFARALAQVVDFVAECAAAEREYQKMRAGEPAPQDPVTFWLIAQRDLEATGSPEWWALDRVARRFQAQCRP